MMSVECRPDHSYPTVLHRPSPTCSCPNVLHNPSPTCSCPTVLHRPSPTCSCPTVLHKPSPTCSCPTVLHRPSPTCSCPTVLHKPSPTCSCPTVLHKPSLPPGSSRSTRTTRRCIRTWRTFPRRSGQTVPPLRTPPWMCSTLWMRPWKQSRSWIWPSSRYRTPADTTPNCLTSTHSTSGYVPTEQQSAAHKVL